MILFTGLSIAATLVSCLQRPQNIESPSKYKRDTQNWYYFVLMRLKKSGFWNGKGSYLEVDDTSSRHSLVIQPHHFFNIRYRAPELLFGSREYTKAVDIWSVGLILGELLLHAPVLPGADEIEQVQLIIGFLGSSPSEDNWPQFRNMPLRKEYWLPPPTESVQNGKMTLKMRFREFSEATRGLMGKCLEWDPEERCSAHSALQHVYFKEEPRGYFPFSVSV